MKLNTIGEHVSDNHITFRYNALLFKGMVVFLLIILTSKNGIKYPPPPSQEFSVQSVDRKK